MKSRPSGTNVCETSAPGGDAAKPAPAARHRIFIVEDHPVYREGLVQTLETEPDLAVCGEAGDAETALPAIGRLRPDLVVVDITLPGKSGLELIKELRAVDRKIKLLVVSMHDEALYADRVLRAGADGYIMKQEEPEEIVHAVRDVLGGHIYVSDEVVAGKPQAARSRRPDPAAQQLARLTDAELEVLEQLGRGQSPPGIARQLGLSRAAVTAHCTQLQRKLKMRSVHALIRYAVCWVEMGAA